MGNAFSTDPYAKAYYAKSKAPTRQQQTEYAQRQIAKAKKMLGDISQGKMPTSDQLSNINFQKGRVCQLGNCDNRRVPKAAVLALYKKGAENFIQAKQRNLVGSAQPHTGGYKPYKAPTKKQTQVRRIPAPPARRTPAPQTQSRRIPVPQTQPRRIPVPQTQSQSRRK
jgi:hypothetical protein